MSDNKTSSQLREELRAAERREEEEKHNKRLTTKPRFRFRIFQPGKEQSYETIMDKSCVIYRLERSCTNVDECVAAGWRSSDQELRGGGMNYLFNRLSGRFVMSFGGGLVLLEDGSWGKPVSTGFAALAGYVVERPEGGDVTNLIPERER